VDSEALRQEPARRHPVAKGLAVVGLVLASCSVLGAVLLARDLVLEVSYPAAHAQQGVWPGLFVVLLFVQLPAGGATGLLYLLAQWLERRRKEREVGGSRLHALFSFVSAAGTVAWGFQALVNGLYLIATFFGA
jgi:hypothetical protein